MNSNTKILSKLWPKMYTGTWGQWQEKFESFVRGKRLQSIFTPNPEQIMMAKQNADFMSVLLSADQYVPDGVGILIANRWKRLFAKELPKVQQKIAGRSVVQWWLRRGGPEKTLLVGSHGDTAAKVALKFDPHGSWLQGVVGLSSVANALSSQPSLKSQEELELLRKRIADWKPMVIFIAFGAPWQEMWIAQNAEWLEKSGVKVAMVCGGALDVLSGKLAAPPKVLEVLGLEWFWRLIQEPWRWRRQVRGAVFFWEVLLRRV